MANAGLQFATHSNPQTSGAVPIVKSLFRELETVRPNFGVVLDNDQPTVVYDRSQNSRFRYGMDRV